MREKALKKAKITILALLSILLTVAIVFMAKPAAHSVYASSLLSQTSGTQATTTQLLEMTDEECIDFVVSSGIEIPDDFIGSPELGSIIRSIIQDVETDPNHEFVFGYYPTQVFAESIRELFNNSSTLSQSQGASINSSITAAAAYALQDNTQYGSWQSNYPNYNCYSYSIGYLENNYTKDRGRYPGQMSGRSFSMSLSIYQMALSVKYDLEAIGYGNVYISNIRPMVLSPNETLISIRKGSSDYHFMKYHPSGDFWTHKPGATAVLKYNYQPSNDRIWKGEYIDSSGNPGLSSTTYNSEIYYIVYNWYGLAIENYTVTGCGQNVLPSNAVIPQGITTIGAGALAGWSGYALSIPSSVTSIGNSAFSGATGLTTIINYSRTTQQINSTTFTDVDTSSINLMVLPGTTSAYRNAGWTGFIITEDAPVTSIATAQQLSNIRNNPNGYYRLANNINLSSFNGGQWDSIPEFRGDFDGNGFAISNLRMENRNASGDSSIHTNWGLFAQNYGAIFNVKLTNVYMYFGVDHSDRMSNVGAIAGTNHKNSNIWIASVSGEIQVHRTCAAVGAVAGRNEGEISAAIVSNMTLEGNGDLGGITGINMFGIVAHSTVTFTNIKHYYVWYNRSIGGIVGYNVQATVTVCSVNNLTISNIGGCETPNKAPWMGMIVGLLQDGNVINVGADLATVVMNPGSLQSHERINFATLGWGWGGNWAGNNFVQSPPRLAN